jgi:putative hemolysin
MSAIPQLAPAPSRGRLYAELAASEADIRAAQVLRYRVFAEELGARLASADAGIDQDRYDAYCQHLLVRESGSERIVGCTRLLTDEQAAKAGSFYSAAEFDLGSVLALPGRRLEVGRTCIDPGYRQGAAIAVLWSGLAGFIAIHGFDYLFGCASIELADGGVRAEAIMNRLRERAMSPAGLRVRPRRPVPPAAPAGAPISAPLPPLLKAYVRLGARACGEPCWDPDFNVADVLMLLAVDELDPTYSRHFMERAIRD